MTDGSVVSSLELDHWGADTDRSNNSVFQPKKFTSYERDLNGSDEAMFRAYSLLGPDLVRRYRLSGNTFSGVLHNVPRF